MSSSPASGSLYSILTFALIAGAYVSLVRALFGWDFPTTDRGQSTIMIIVFIAGAFYAMLVGRHRDVTYTEALRRGGIDLGRKIKGMVLR